MRFREQSKLGLENRGAAFPAYKKEHTGGRTKKNPAQMGQENSLLSSVSCSPAVLTGTKCNYKIDNNNG